MAVFLISQMREADYTPGVWGEVLVKVAEAEGEGTGKGAKGLRGIKGLKGRAGRVWAEC
jgi:hypothetical protein